jgi:hypothetical protein
MVAGIVKISFGEMREPFTVGSLGFENPIF